MPSKEENYPDILELMRQAAAKRADEGPAGHRAPGLWRTPVYLALCPNEGQLLLNLQCLFSVCREPFILLAPTARHRSELIGAMLQRERCAFLPLASCLSPEGSGFRLIAPVAPVLDRFAAGLAGLENSESSKRKVESGKRPAWGSRASQNMGNTFGSEHG